jgi:hypothetical protein
VPDGTPAVLNLVNDSSGQGELHARWAAVGERPRLVAAGYGQQVLAYRRA